jgi:endonuclease/exonuclease/phosphatase family metal-dependent hydrolase
MSMNGIEADSFARGCTSLQWPRVIRVVSWNINRGFHLNEIIDYLTSVSADLVLLQEADVGARRTNYRNTPREIARALHMHYVFGREFEELSQERRGSPAYHGQATLSRFPLLYPHILNFSRQSAFWHLLTLVPFLSCLPRRLGARMALVCEMIVQSKRIVVYNTHLESRGNEKLRASQFSEILTDSCSYAPKTPILLAGDFNSDISRKPLATLCGKQFINYFTSLHGQSTVAHCHPWKSAAIDWILATPTLSATRLAIHDAISASDHYPLFLEFDLNAGQGTHERFATKKYP